MDKPKKALKTLNRIETFLKKEIDGGDRILSRYNGADWSSSPAVAEAVERIQSRMAFAKNDLDFVRGEMKIVKKANKLVASPKKKKADKPAQEAAAE
jgi:hypothetical protein